MLAGNDFNKNILQEETKQGIDVYYNIVKCLYSFLRASNVNNCRAERDNASDSILLSILNFMFLATSG